MNLTAPAIPRSRAGYWQIVNRQGVHVPGGRLWVKVNVVADSSDGASTDKVAAFYAEPPSPSSAKTVRFHARVHWWSGYRAMRLLVRRVLTYCLEGTPTSSTTPEPDCAELEIGVVGLFAEKYCKGERRLFSEARLFNIH